MIDPLICDTVFAVVQQPSAPFTWHVRGDSTDHDLRQALQKYFQPSNPSPLSTLFDRAQQEGGKRAKQFGPYLFTVQLILARLRIRRGGKT